MPDSWVAAARCAEALWPAPDAVWVDPGVPCDAVWDEVLWELLARTTATMTTTATTPTAAIGMSGPRDLSVLSRDAPRAGGPAYCGPPCWGSAYWGLPYWGSAYWGLPYWGSAYWGAPYGGPGCCWGPPNVGPPYCGSA